jgi:septal ring-binding cell division protein DamX
MPNRDRASELEPSNGQHEAPREHSGVEQPEAEQPGAEQPGAARAAAPAERRRQHPLDPEGWLATSRHPQEPSPPHSAEHGAEHGAGPADRAGDSGEPGADATHPGQTLPQGRSDPQPGNLVGDHKRPEPARLRALAHDWAGSDAAAAHQDLLRRLRRLGMLSMLGFILLLAAILGIALQPEGPLELEPEMPLASDPRPVDANRNAPAAAPAPPPAAPATARLERRIAELEVDLMHLRARLETVEAELHAPEAAGRPLQLERAPTAAPIAAPTASPAAAPAATPVATPAASATPAPGSPERRLARVDPFGNPFLAALLSREARSAAESLPPDNDGFTLTKPQYALQLAAFREPSAALAFAAETGLERWSLFLDPQPPWTFVLNGFFEDAETARAARAELPAPVQRNRPIIRKLEADTRLQRLPAN